MKQTIKQLPQVRIILWEEFRSSIHELDKDMKDSPEYEPQTIEDYINMCAGEIFDSEHIITQIEVIPVQDDKEDPNRVIAIIHYRIDVKA